MHVLTGRTPGQLGAVDAIMGDSAFDFYRLLLNSVFDGYFLGSALYAVLSIKKRITVRELFDGSLAISG